MKKIKPDALVLILSLASLIWVILYKTIFLYKDEFLNIGSEIGEIAYGILTSVVASGIFYYFVVYLDRKRKEKPINEIVKSKLKSISVSLHHIKNATFPYFNLSPNGDIQSLEEFTDVCRGIDLRTNAPNIPNATNQPMTWYQYFDFFFKSDNYNSSLLYQHIIYLDINLVELLDEIQYSDFQRALDSFRRDNLTNDISGAAGPFWLYLKNLEALRKYLQKIIDREQPITVRIKKSLINFIDNIKSRK